MGVLGIAAISATAFLRNATPSPTLPRASAGARENGSRLSRETPPTFSGCLRPITKKGTRNMTRLYDIPDYTLDELYDY